MSGALFARIKNWGATDTVINTDLNAEFDNILTNFKPQMMDAYSANATQMQVQTNPGGVGTESLATSLSGEIERLRFQLAAITGNTYWYSSPATTLSALNTALGANTQANSVTSGRMLSTSSQPVYIVPSGSTNSISIKATTTPLVYKIAGTTYTLSADTTVSSLTTAPSSNNTCTVNDTNLAGAAWTNLVGENGSQITVSAMGSSITALVGQIAAFKTAGSEYILCRVESTTSLTQVSRGFFFQSNDTLFSRTTVTNGDTLTLMKLTWVYLNTAGTATVVYTNPKVGGTAPSSPATGDYWYDTVNNIWKTYNSTTFVASNNTLIGMCIQSATVTIGARSLDFYKSYSDLNTIELIAESTTALRSRNTGGAINVYGTSLQFGPDFVRWDSSVNMDSGQTFSASTFYYAYIKESGDSILSNIAPLDRRADLRGFYHPLNTWRCVGYAFANGSTQFAGGLSTTTGSGQEVESFFRTDEIKSVSTLTAAVSNFPLPYIIGPREDFIQLDSSGGIFTQTVPPAAQYKGKEITYTKSTTDGNVITLVPYGTGTNADRFLGLRTTFTTTANNTNGNATISTVASLTGIAVGSTISGTGIPASTTVLTVSGSTLTVSANSTSSNTGFTLTSTGIMSSALRLCQAGETYRLKSNGVDWRVVGHQYDTSPIVFTPVFAALGTITVTNAYYYRQGKLMLGQVKWTNGTVSGSTATHTIPDSWNIDNNIIGIECIGQLAQTGSTATMHVICDSATSTTLLYFSSTAGNYQTKFVGNNFDVSGTNTISYTIPIKEWMG